MSDAHLDPKVPARIPADDLTAGRAELNARQWTVQEFVVACFRALRDNADALLPVIDRHRPEAKKRGRPRKSEQP